MGRRGGGCGRLEVGNVRREGFWGDPSSAARQVQLRKKNRGVKARNAKLRA